MNPNWYGIPNIGFIWHNEWADPELEYKGNIINSHTVEDTMWERFCEKTGSEDIDQFTEYMKINVDEVYELLDLVITGGDLI